MSHDRKPARVRVLDGAADAAGRRRSDVPPTIIDAASARAAGNRRGVRSGRSRVLNAMLFLGGSAIGGAAITWLGIGLR